MIVASNLLDGFTHLLSWWALMSWSNLIFSFSPLLSPACCSINSEFCVSASRLIPLIRLLLLLLLWDWGRLSTFSSWEVMCGVCRCSDEDELDSCELRKDWGTRGGVRSGGLRGSFCSGSCTLLPPTSSVFSMKWWALSGTGATMKDCGSLVSACCCWLRCWYWGRGGSAGRWCAWLWWLDWRRWSSSTSHHGLWDW